MADKMKTDKLEIELGQVPSLNLNTENQSPTNDSENSNINCFGQKTSYVNIGFYVLLTFQCIFFIIFLISGILYIFIQTKTNLNILYNTMVAYILNGVFDIIFVTIKYGFKVKKDFILLVIFSIQKFILLIATIIVIILKLPSILDISK